MYTLGFKQDNSLFSNTFGFLRLPVELDPYNTQSNWVITGVPFDMATSGRPGSRFGPHAIRQASINLAWERCRWPWTFDFRNKLQIVDCGDLIYNTGNIKEFTYSLQHHSEKLLFSGKKMFSLGGDHYITLPILRAYSKRFGKIAIMHFDAHVDCDNSNSQYDHGSVISHAIHEDLIDPVHSIHIGVRTEYSKDLGFTVLDAEYVNDVSLDMIAEKISSIVKLVPTYLTFDIDCLDPSIAPGTGTPVIGGIMSQRILRLIRSLKMINIVGIDFVEVAPIYDCAQITALTAATLGLELLYLVCE